MVYLHFLRSWLNRIPFVGRFEVGVCCEGIAWGVLNTVWEGWDGLGWIGLGDYCYSSRQVRRVLWY